MIDELRRLLAEEIETEVFEISQHTRPKLLKQALQEAINRADGKHDFILLGYGLCSNAVAGLVASKSTLVIPRIHDCIGIFLGSNRAYQAEMAHEPAYFLTHGYITGYTIASCGPLAEVDRAARRYGREHAERIVGEMMKPYKRLVYIHTSEASDLEKDRRYSRDMATHFHMRYEEKIGTSILLHKLVNQNWDDDFVVAAPGQTITIEQFMN